MESRLGLGRIRRTKSLGVNMTKDVNPSVDKHVGYRVRMRRKMLGLPRRRWPTRSI